MQNRDMKTPEIICWLTRSLFFCFSCFLAARELTVVLIHTTWAQTSSLKILQHRPPSYCSLVNADSLYSLASLTLFIAFDLITETLLCSYQLIDHSWCALGSPFRPERVIRLMPRLIRSLKQSANSAYPACCFVSCKCWWSGVTVQLEVRQNNHSYSLKKNLYPTELCNWYAFLKIFYRIQLFCLINGLLKVHLGYLKVLFLSPYVYPKLKRRCCGEKL